MKVILHIGWPKTATSFLQMFFAQNAEELFNRGLMYPELFNLDAIKKGKYGQGNAYSLAYYLLDNKQQTICTYPPITLNELEHLLKSLPKNKNILLSTEWFTALSQDSLFKLREVFWDLGSTVSVIAYIRPILELLDSEYAQGAKLGAIHSNFREWSFKVDIDYLKVLNRYAEVFGKDQFMIRPFSKEYWEFNSIHIDFLKACGINYSDERLLVPSEVNVSLYPNLLMAQRQASNYDINLSEQDLLVLQDLIKRNRVSQHTGKGTWIPQELVHDVLNKHKMDCEVLSKLYNIPLDFLLRDTKSNSLCYESLDYSADFIGLSDLIRSSPLISQMTESRRLSFCRFANVLALEGRPSLREFMNSKLITTSKARNSWTEKGVKQ